MKHLRFFRLFLPVQLLFLLLILPVMSGAATNTVPSDSYQTGFQAFSRGDYSAAVDAFLNSLKERYDHLPTYYYLGLSYKNLKQYDNALFTFRRILEFRRIDPEFQTEIYIEMIRTALLADQYKKAVQYGLAGLRCGIRDPLLLNELGRAYLCQKNYKNSRKAVELALSMEPDNPVSYNLLGLIYMETDRLDSALTAFETAIAFRGDVALYHANAARACERKNDLPKALEYYQKAAALQPAPEYRQAVKRLTRTLQDRK